MIISASYKTDIPTFYGEWFIRRLRARSCKMVNPYNRKVVKVSLDQRDVDGFVFWTKNIGPFVPRLEEVKSRGFPFVVQHTINGYPRELEHAVVNADRSVENLATVAQSYGSHACVWRYDTIVFSNLTPVEFHLERFSNLASALQGVTDEVVISFVHAYAKTRRNMAAAERESGLEWRDPSVEEKQNLASRMVGIARDHHMQLSICSQREFLVPGANDARCVDADRLERVGGNRVRASLKGNRKECGCFASRDIGEYDTCPHGCIYCYAVRNQDLAQKRYKNHDPHSEFLFEPEFPVTEPPDKNIGQLGLFDEQSGT